MIYVQILYYNTNNKKYLNFKTIDALMHHLYYNLGIITNKSIILNLSKNKNLFPMYDIYTENIVLIKYTELYQKITEHYIRPISPAILNIIKKNNIIKHINFLKNFNINLLYNTFLQNVYEVSPITNELTECVRPSFLPIFKHIEPYYTKTELIFLSLNVNNINKTDNNNLCNIAIKSDITFTELLNHQLYIKKNNLDTYIKYYSFIGFININHYLRYQNKNFRDINIEKTVNNFTLALTKSPAWEKNYIFYRWIRDDSFLQKKSILVEQGFISATRNPFIDLEKMTFGFILIKIKVPAKIKGCGLAIEYYSHFPQEQEIIFPPSKYKINKSSDITFYHPNIKINEKILIKYEFEWIEHLTNYIDPTLFKMNEIINELDENYVLTGYTLYDKLNNFYKDFPSKFYYKLENTKVLFLVNKIKYGVYSKFFFVTSYPERDNQLIDKELFFILQDYDTNEIIFFIEISVIISLNYYNRYNPTSIIYKNYDSIINMLTFMSKLFNISDIIIHPEYQKFSSIISNSTSKKLTLTQSYISDCFYYNELLFLYMQDQHNESKISKFTNYLLNNKNISPSLSKKTINYIMQFNLHKFIENFKSNNTIHTSSIDKICIISNKLIKLNNKSTLQDIYNYLFYNYYYLVDFFINDMLTQITKDNLNNIIFIIKNNFFIHNYSE